MENREPVRAGTLDEYHEDPASPREPDQRAAEAS